MAMVTPESVAMLSKLVDNAPHENITLHRTVLRGILSEIAQLQGAVSLSDQQKIDIVQKLTLEFSVQSLCDSLIELSKQEFGQLTTAEVLVMAANNLRNTIVERVKTPGGTA